MPTPTRLSHLPVALACWLAGSWLSSAALAAGANPAPTAQTRYLQDRAVCLSGHANQDRSTCLQEAGAARDEALRGDLATPGSAAYFQRNAQRRCAPLPEPERGDCMARMSGQGIVEGSVSAGGLLRERITEVPAAASAPLKP